MDRASKSLGRKYWWHIESVKVIAEYWKDKGLLEQYGKDFFGWSVGFTSWDLCNYSGTDKGELIQKLFSVWEEFDLLKYKKKLSVKQKYDFYCLEKAVRKV